MSDEIYFEGVKYISAADAAGRFNLTRDYIARLARDGKIRGRRIGKYWFVNDESLDGFLQHVNLQKEVRKRILSQKRASEYQALNNDTLPMFPDSHTSDTTTNSTANVALPLMGEQQATEPVAVNESDVGTAASSIQELDEGKKIAAQSFLKAEPVVSKSAYSMLQSPAGITHAAIQSLPTSYHVIAPAVEVLHKILALSLALSLVFGAYSAIDPQYASFVKQSALESVTETKHSFQHVAAVGAVAGNEIGLEDASQSAALSVNDAPNIVDDIMHMFGTGMISFVSSLFGTSLPAVATVSSQKGGNSQAVAVNQPATQQYEPATSQISYNSPTPQQVTQPRATTTVVYQTIVQQPVVERVVTEQRVVNGGGGVDESELNARLSALQSGLSQQLSAAQNANSSQFIAVNQAVSRSSPAVSTTIVNSSSDAGSMTGTLLVAHGGTGLSVYAPGDILYANSSTSLASLPVGQDGQVLKMVGGAPTWGADLTGGGGGLWATTTNGLALYPGTPSMAVMVGTAATSTAGNILEVAGNALFRNSLIAYGTVGAVSFNATSTAATSTFAGGATFATASTSNLIVSNSLTLGGLSGILKATAGVVSSALVDLTSDVAGVLPVSHGGTGLATIQSGTVLVGNGTDALATTTRGSVSEAGSNVLTISGGANAVLGSGVTIKVAQANGSTNGFLASGDWTTFNNKQAALAFSYPLTNVANTISLGFGTTTNNTWAGTNTFINNVAMANATSSNFAITNVTSSLLKTNTNGSVVPAVAGVDYASPSALFGYLFPNNATTTSIGFNGGLTATSIGAGSVNATNATIGTLSSTNGTISTLGSTNLSATNASISGLLIPGLSATILKTNASGHVVAATPGVDYATFNYLFPGNATSTNIGFNGGLTASNATIGTINSTSGTISILAANTSSLGNATATSFAISSLGATMLKTDSSGHIIPAIAGSDYLTSLSGAASSTVLADNNTFSGSDTFANTITGNLAGNVTGNVTGNISGNAGGNANTATALQTARSINGVAFDGTSDITLNAASSTELSDNNTFSGSNAFASVSANSAILDSLTSSNGTITTLGSTNLSAIDASLANLVAGSSTLTNFFAANGTIDTLGATNLSASNGSISSLTANSASLSALLLPGLSAGMLKTDASGQVTTATPGVDYTTFGYLFPGNATSTSIGFNGGLTANNATIASLVATTGNIDGLSATTGTINTLTASSGSITTLTASNGTITTLGTTNLSASNGNIDTLNANTSSLGNATATSFAISSLGATMLKTDSSGHIIPAIAGSDYLTSLSGAASSTVLADNNTFSGSDTFANTITGNLAGNVTGNVTGNISGNAGGNANTATALQTARSINGVSFDGTSDITLNAASSTELSDNNTFSGSNAFASVSANSAILDSLTSSNGTITTLGSTNLSAIDTSLANLVAGSSTLTNFFAANGTIDTLGATNLSASNGSISSLTANSASLSALLLPGLSAGMLKTDASGQVTTATPGVDYTTFGYLFPGNATSTSIGFNGGLTANNATIASLVATTGNIDGLSATTGTINTLTASSGSITTLTASNGTITTLGTTNLSASNGNIDTLNANTSSLGNATATSFAISSLGATMLKTDSSGHIIPAIAGSDYLTSLSGAASSTVLADNNTFSGSDTFANTITGNLAGNVTGNVTGNISGNAGGNANTATALQTARSINGVSFDGTSDITLNAASSTELSDNNTFSGSNAFASVSANSAILDSLTSSNGTITTLGSTNLSAIDTSLANLVAGSSTLTNFFAANGTIDTLGATNLSASNGSISSLTANSASLSALLLPGLSAGMLKTDASGQVTTATPGVDYTTFGYLFPGNATSTSIGFNGGLTANNATIASLVATTGNIDGLSATTGTINTLTASSGSITTLTASNGTITTLGTTNLSASNGNIDTLNANTSSLGNATATSFAISSLGATMLKTDSSGHIIPAIAGSDYLTSLSGAASSTVLADNNIFSGSDTFANTITGNLAGNVTGNVTGNISGNAGGNANTATALQTARSINGVSFDGTSDITLNAASSTELSDNNTFSGSNTFASVSANSAILDSLTSSNGTITTLGSTNLSAIDASLANLVAGSSTLTNFFAANGTIDTLGATNLSASNGSISSLTANSASLSALLLPGLSAGMLKTDASGQVTTATPGVDYTTFGYLFPGNATSTSIGFNGGLTANNATIASLVATTGNIDGLSATTGTINTLTASSGSITTLTASNGTITTLGTTNLSASNGNIDTLNANTSSLGNATATSFAISSLGATMLKTDSSGHIIPAIAGSDYLTSLSGAASSTVLADNNTFSGSDTFANTITGNLAGNVTGNVTGNISGNANTATALQTARSINGVSFDGTSDITLNAASSTELSDNNTFSGSNAFASVSANSAILDSLTSSNGTITTLGSTNLSAIDASLANLVAGSSTLTNFFAASGTIDTLGATNLSASNGSISSLTANSASLSALLLPGLSAGMLKTDASGQVTTATPGVDYTTFGYLFPGNATSTSIGFNGGLTANNATIASLVATTGNIDGLSATTGTINTLTASSGSITTLTASNGTITTLGTTNLSASNGNIDTLNANTSSLGNATATSFAISSLGATMLKTDSSGHIIPAIAGSDYLTSLSGAASSTVLADNNTFSGSDSFANTITGNLAGNVTGNVTGNISGNANTATALQTARSINGVSFDGTSDITLNAASSTELSDNNTFSGKISSLASRPTAPSSTPSRRVTALSPPWARRTSAPSMPRLRTSWPALPR